MLFARHHAHTTTALGFHQLSLSTFLRMAEHALPLSVSRDISFQLLPLVDADAYSGTAGTEALICTTTVSVVVHANHIQRAIFFPVSNQPGFSHGEVPSRVLFVVRTQRSIQLSGGGNVRLAGSTDVAVCFHFLRIRQPSSRCPKIVIRPQTITLP